VKDLVNSSKKILIVVPSQVCFDTLCAVFGLAQALSREDKTITIGCSSKLPKEFETLLPYFEFNVINTLGPKEIILSLNRLKGDVKSVRWRETKDEIQFIITPQDKDFEYNEVNLEDESDVDLIITIGCKDLDSIGTLYSERNDVFADNKILNIDINPKNQKYGFQNEVSSENSLSEKILEVLERDDFQPTKQAAETLFKGVFWANEGLRSDGHLQDTYEKLSRYDVKPFEQISTLYDTLSIAELRYIGKMISNLRVEQDEILISVVPNSDLQGVKLDRITFPELNILSRIASYKLTLIITEYEPGKVLVKAYTKNKSINLIDTYSKYSPQGKSYQITFAASGNLSVIEKQLIEEFKGTKETVKKPSIKDAEKEMFTESEKKEKEETTPLQKAESLPHAVEPPPITPMPPLTNQPRASQSFPTPMYPPQPLSPAQ
jgi:nanoRNase/pAp phosphatase (c-di-AMP/oligoRNAs hydrolase)